MVNAAKSMGQSVMMAMRMGMWMALNPHTRFDFDFDTPHSALVVNQLDDELELFAYRVCVYACEKERMDG